MNTQQQNKLAMYIAVKAVCDVNISVWQRSPAFVDAYMNFVLHLANIQRPPPAEARENNGGQDKLEAQQMMCQAAITIASAIRGHAMQTSNTIVAKAINFSIADLMREADADSARHCRNIHDLAETSLDHLAAQSITAAKLGMLQMAIANFEAIVGRPRPNISFRGAPSWLSDEFAAADKTLSEGLDNLIEQFQFINAKFINDYRNVRTLADTMASPSPAKDEAGSSDRAASA